jgi:hypothetical protein
MLFEERVSVISFMSYLMDIGCLELIGVCNTVLRTPAVSEPIVRADHSAAFWRARMSRFGIKASLNLQLVITDFRS